MSAAADGMFNVRDFGARGNNEDDDSDAFEAAIREIGRVGGISDGFHRSGVLFIPAGEYVLSRALRLDDPLILQGAGERGTTLRFPAGSPGVVVEMQFKTPALGTTGGWSKLATTTVVRDLTVLSPEAHPAGIPSDIADAASPSDTRSGIVLHTKARIENVRVVGFRHDGIHISTSTGLHKEHNANHWQLQNCFVGTNGRHGLFVSGGDANVGIAIGVVAQANRRWGIWDQSNSGNTYLGCSVEAGAGGYRTVDQGGRHLLIGCYKDADQSGLITYPTMIIGGNNQNIPWDYAVAASGDPVVIHNEGNARLRDLDLPGPLTQQVHRIRHIAASETQDIAPLHTIVLGDAAAISGPPESGANLFLRLPPPSAIRPGHHHIVKKVDATTFPVRVLAGGDGTTVPSIDGETSVTLATHGSFVSVIFDGRDWQVIGRG